MKKTCFMLFIALMFVPIACTNFSEATYTTRGTKVDESYRIVSQSKQIWVQKTTRRIDYDSDSASATEKKEILICDAATAMCSPVGIKCGLDNDWCEIMSDVKYTRTEYSSGQESEPDDGPEPDYGY